MAFPLVVGGHAVPDAPALAALVRRVRDGALEPALAVGLAAVLIEHPAPETVCEGARLAAALGDPQLGPLVLLALEGHDLALLLSPDPAIPGASVEDGLLAAACRLVDL